VCNGTELYPQTLFCQNSECMMRVRIGRLLKQRPTRIGAFSFCPMCGGKATVKTDEKETYMESLAKVYNMPVEAITVLLNLWNVHEHIKFSDFVAEIRKEAVETK
jgi:hypothetical protein